MNFPGPISLDQLTAVRAAAKAKQKSVKLLCANTAAGVTKYLAPPDRIELDVVFVDVSRLQELTGTSWPLRGAFLSGTPKYKAFNTICIYFITCIYQ